jgi:Cysteine-rich secretory protein family
MQGDGNLAVYKGTDPDHPDRNAPNNGFVWGSVQAGQYPARQGQYFAIMQGDGNLAVYKGTDPGHPDRNAPNNGFVWGSVQDGQYPARQGQYFVIMQGDGNLAVYKGTDPGHPDRNAPNNGFVWGSIQSNRRIAAAVPPPHPPPEQQQTLEAHNRERQHYPGVGPLQWSPELAQWAQEWAEGRAREGNINHRKIRRIIPSSPVNTSAKISSRLVERRRPEPTPFNGGSRRSNGTIMIKMTEYHVPII